MLSLLAAASFGFASVASASPLIARQSSAPWCAGLGSGAIGNATHFQLAAYNLTLPNANSTGAPLVVAFHEYTGSATGSYYATLTTSFSYPTSFNNVPFLSLENGALLPNASGAHSTDLAVSAGQYVEFEISTEQTELPSPAQSYCIVEHFDRAGNAPLPTLAVNGVTDGFSLCASDTPLDSGVPYDVVFQATNDTSVNDHIYNYSTCYPVRLQVVYEPVLYPVAAVARADDSGLGCFPNCYRK